MQKAVSFEGLSQKEAERILATDGLNELPSQKKQNVFFLLLKVLSEPMLLLLIGSGTIYLYLGELQDALVLLFSVFVVIAITFYQERKTEKTLEALRDLSSPRALVIRDGEEKRIPGKEVVRGDVIILREGDRVPADAMMLSCENLTIDESLLTGESVPVRKAEWDGRAEPQRPGGEDLPFVYSGSLVTSGRGIARIHATGLHTEIGKIGKSLESIKDEDTLLHKETRKIVRIVAGVGLTLCVIVVVSYVLLRGSLIDGLLAGLTLSMAILPEEFPVVLVVFLTLGAWRISRRKVLARRSAAIETLGAASVLCTDKTGTLTLNKMELSSLYAGGSFYELSRLASTRLEDSFRDLLVFGVLASQEDPFDPMEKELHKMSGLYLKKADNPYRGHRFIKAYPLSKKLLALSHVWQSEDGEYAIASKGSPEAIVRLCGMEGDQEQEVLEKVREMSERGLRVLGVARADSPGGKLPKNQQDFTFSFVGLLGFVDPIRSTAAGAVREAYGAGMRVIMITGDYSGTAQFVARKIGIKHPENFLTGDDIEKMTHRELREKVQSVNIFARVVPEQKLLLVNALKANNEIVAMTGDGVNDAPALKTAHIGVAMGERGTDVAREASALVLLNDDFSSIVAAVRLGRRIYDNLKRAMGYILAVHVPIAGMSMLPIFFNFPIVLFPAHIAFMELIIDPACSIVFESEKEDKGIMKRPPRNLRQSIFSSKTVAINLAQGFGALIATFTLFAVALSIGYTESEARAVAFASLVLGNIALIVTNLSWSQLWYTIILSAHRIFFFVTIGAVACLFVVLYVPFFSGLFYLSAIRLSDLVLIGTAAFMSILWFEVLKFFDARRSQKFLA